MDTFFGFIATPLSYLLSGIYSVVSNYGITLLIFTLIVRLCLFPLYLGQIKGQIAMGRLQPRMKELQKKYANDRGELGVQMQKLYKEEGYNPAKGCLPMLIQMPILLGLFYLLRTPLTYVHTDAMIFAVHESFLWIPDLSQPDPWILPIISGITTFFSFSITSMQSQVDPSQANQMAGMMKMMKYFFPVMIVWMGHTFPAGLAFYWFLGNVFTIVQYQVLRIVRKKIERQMEEGTGGKKK
ncbi:MAG: YidC/Oxa1 family membrane protein insertase [Clostridiales Family XIII bacterium]|nr:YidC/Oxa1 family membrane protein insertase [Clostridiales Family XIII bacterium]